MQEAVVTQGWQVGLAWVTCKRQLPQVCCGAGTDLHSWGAPGAGATPGMAGV